MKPGKPFAYGPHRRRASWACRAARCQLRHLRPAGAALPAAPAGRCFSQGSSCKRIRLGPGPTKRREFLRVRHYGRRHAGAFANQARACFHLGRLGRRWTAAGQTIARGNAFAFCRSWSCCHDPQDHPGAVFRLHPRAVGTGHETLQTGADTLGALRDELIARQTLGPAALARGRAVRMALNQVMAQDTTPLAPGAEGCVLPPVTRRLSAASCAATSFASAVQQCSRAPWAHAGWHISPCCASSAMGAVCSVNEHHRQQGLPQRAGARQVTGITPRMKLGEAGRPVRAMALPASAKRGEDLRILARRNFLTAGRRRSVPGSWPHRRQSDGPDAWMLRQCLQRGQLSVAPVR